MENTEGTYKVPKGIIRFEQGATKGWWARARREGTRFSQMFSDNKYGSPELALEHAKAFLEELNRVFPRAKATPRTKKRDSSTGPMPGVWKQKTKSRGHEYWEWHVQWSPEPGVVKTKRFSINKYGDTGAMRKAIAVRLEALENLKASNIEEYHAQIKEIPKDLINSGLLEFSVPDRSGRHVNITHYSYEGERKYSLHLLIERSKQLRTDKIKRFIKDHGSIFCQLCNENMSSKYPWIEKDFIEVHHIIPLSELTSPICSNLDDLVLLCPSCHVAIHQGNAQDNFIEAMIYFNKDLL